jgi:hypothetical protein
MLKEKAGRTGRFDMPVTPVLYLQLLHSLKTGRTVTYKGAPLLYNLPQLQLAFSHYLRKNKGPWDPDEIRDLAGLEKLAKNYIDKQQDKFEQQRKKVQKPDQSAKTTEKKEFLLLEKLGLAPEKDGPEKDLKMEKFSRAEKEDNDFRAALKGESVIEILSTIGEPTTTVALGLLMIALQSELTDKICEVMLKCYQDHAKNPQEKEVILNALESVMGDAERAKLQNIVDDVLRFETLETYRQRLHKLKQAREREDEKLALYRDNKKLAEVEERAPEEYKTNSSYGAPSPKIDFTDPAFGGSGKRDRDED